MERLSFGKCRRRFFLVAVAAFIFWFMLIYLFNADVVVDDGAVVLLTAYPSNTMVDTSRESQVTETSADDPARAVMKMSEENLLTLSDSVAGVQDDEKEPPKEEEKSGHDDRSNTLPVAEAPKASDDLAKTLEIALEPPPASRFDTCAGRYVFVMRLPRRFNDDLLRSCRSLSTWTDMCETLSNSGLGPSIPKSERVLGKTGWYSTNQFSLEVIFHNRMKQYKCLTNDSTIASAIFIPYYAGLDVAQYLWHSTEMRDIGPGELVKWLKRRPEWKVMLGKDHFMVAGRIAWDFRRETFLDSDWGTNLLVLPEVKNMTSLVLESTLIVDANDFAIPYPTYFHPSNDEEIIHWQDRMRGLRRRYLFSFAGARRPNLPNSIRDEIIDQCRASKRKCKLLECYSRGNTCYRPVNLMSLFQSSEFCLQPQGDSYTRRSTFDSILAGCIPVFFHSGSAYDQYKWHLPIDHTRYSVFIPEKDIKDKKANINSLLSRIPKRKVEEMREEVIGLIPKILYADPRFKLETFEDAFDLTVQGVLERIDSIRRGER